MMKLNRKKKGVIITAAILAVLLFVILMPLYWAFTLSFDGDAIIKLPTFRFWPENPSLKSYQYAFERLDLVRYYGNTLFLTVINTCISVFVAMMCGFAFAKGLFWGKTFWYLYMLAVMLIPFESRMYPLYQQYASWGMINTYWPLILGNFAYVFGTFFSRTSIAALPDALIDAAHIDGMGEWRIFLQIILPLQMPIIATLCIMQIIAQWNSYLWPLAVLRSQSKQVISVGISLFNASETSKLYGPRLAVAMLSSVPLIIVFLILQKNIVESIAVTGIKQ